MIKESVENEVVNELDSEDFVAGEIPKSRGLVDMYEEYFVDFNNLMEEVSFLESPQSTYAVRARPAILTCKAVNAGSIRFMCNNKWIPNDQIEYETSTDSKTGKSVLRATLELSRTDVESNLSEAETFSCHCFAAKTSKDSDGIKSQSADIKIAYIRKHFYQSPVSDRVAEGKTIQLPCVPPEGDPKVEVSWTKNGHVIMPDDDANLILAGDGSLIISATRLVDSGNYSCEAKNLANRRVTDPAEIVVYVDGNWSPWSQWQGACSVNCPLLQTHIDMSRGDEQALQLIIPSQRRTRVCNNPVPINGGKRCAGAEEDFRPCPHDCKVNGSWSKWASWSECNVDCQRIRTRQCSAPEPLNGGLGCQGREMETVNCTEGVLPLHCQPGNTFFQNNRHDPRLTQPQNLDPFNGSQIYILGSLFCFAFLLLVIIGLIVTLVCRRKRSEKDQVYFPGGSVHTVLLQQQKAALLSQLSTRDVQYMCTPPPAPYSTLPGNTLNTNPYPNNYTLKSNKSYVSGYSTTPHILGGSRAALINDYSSSNTSSNGGSATGVTPLKRPHGRISPTEEYATLYDCVNDQYAPSSSYSDGKRYSNPNVDQGATIVAAQVDSDFSRIELKKCGASVTMSENTFTESTMVFVAVSDDIHDRPSLKASETWLSSVVEFDQCENERMKVVPARPVVISMEHHASTFPKDNWDFSLYADYGQGWEVATRLGDENINTNVYVKMERQICHLMTDKFGRFLLAGSPKPNKTHPSKRVRVIAYATLPVQSLGDSLSVRVYVVPDLVMAMENVSKQELDQRSSVITTSKEFLMNELGDLCLGMDDTITHSFDGYTLPNNGVKYMEIPTSKHSWCSQNGIHCNLSLTITSENKSKVMGRISFYQKDNNLSEKLILPFEFNPFLKPPPALPVPDGSKLVVQESKLNLETKRRLARLLDQPVESEKDWRGLAKKIGLERYLQYFGVHPGCSPTTLILDLWEASVYGSHTALLELYNSIKTLGRLDAANLLECYLPQS